MRSNVREHLDIYAKDIAVLAYAAVNLIDSLPEDEQMGKIQKFRKKFAQLQEKAEALSG